MRSSEKERRRKKKRKEDAKYTVWMRKCWVRIMIADISTFYYLIKPN
jgi:hypothetical protein